MITLLNFGRTDNKLMNMLQKIENQDQSIKHGDVTCYFRVFTCSICVMKKIQVPISHAILNVSKLMCYFIL